MHTYTVDLFVQRRESSRAFEDRAQFEAGCGIDQPEGDEDKFRAM